MRRSWYARLLKESNVGTLFRYYTYTCAVLVVLDFWTILVMLQRDVTRSWDITVIIFFRRTGCTGLNGKGSVCKRNIIFRRYITRNKTGVIAQTGAPFPLSPRKMQIVMINNYVEDRNCDTLKLQHLDQCALFLCCVETLSSESRNEKEKESSSAVVIKKNPQHQSEVTVSKSLFPHYGAQCFRSANIDLWNAVVRACRRR